MTMVVMNPERQGSKAESVMMVSRPTSVGEVWRRVERVGRTSHVAGKRKTKSWHRHSARSKSTNGRRTRKTPAEQRLPPAHMSLYMHRPMKQAHPRARGGGKVRCARLGNVRRARKTSEQSRSSFRRRVHHGHTTLRKRRGGEGGGEKPGMPNPSGVAEPRVAKKTCNSKDATVSKVHHTCNGSEQGKTGTTETKAARAASAARKS